MTHRTHLPSSFHLKAYFGHGLPICWAEGCGIFDHELAPLSMRTHGRWRPIKWEHNSSRTGMLNLGVAQSAQRPIADDDEVGHATEREDVGCSGGLLAREYFWCRPPQCASQGLGLR